MNSEVEHLLVCLLKILFLLTLQYLEFCDQIILFEDGKICEKGIHSELIQKRGRYAQLIQKMHGKATEVIFPYPTLTSDPTGRTIPCIHGLCFLPRVCCREEQRQKRIYSWKVRPRPLARKNFSMKMLVIVLNEIVLSPGSRVKPSVCLSASSTGSGISS